jgi:hypothetical protein
VQCEVHIIKFFYIINYIFFLMDWFLCLIIELDLIIHRLLILTV